MLFVLAHIHRFIVEINLILINYVIFHKKFLNFKHYNLHLYYWIIICIFENY